MSILAFLFKRKNRTNRGFKPRTARLALDEPVRVRLLSGEEGPAILQDVSAGGAALRTHQSIRVGEHLGLSMYLGVQHRYELQARVIYARPGSNGFHARYGVQFVAISHDERERLDAFVNGRVSASQYGVRAFAASNLQ
jgi:hypothetical protein